MSLNIFLLDLNQLIFLTYESDLLLSLSTNKSITASQLKKIQATPKK